METRERTERMRKLNGGNCRAKRTVGLRLRPPLQVLGVRGDDVEQRGACAVQECDVRASTDMTPGGADSDRLVLDELTDAD